MEYFIIEQDRRLDSIGRSISFSERILQGFEYAEKHEVVYAESDKALEYTCIIDRPVLLVSDELRNIFKEFEPELEHKTVVVMDLARQIQFPYSMMNLIEVSCSNQQLPYIRTGQSDELVIDESQVNGLCIFRITYYKSSYLVVRLDVAERLLRKSMYGLKLRRIQTMGCDQSESTT